MPIEYGENVGATAHDRLSKFANEWRKMMSRGRDDMIYELNAGSPTRWAECRLSDIEELLTYEPR